MILNENITIKATNKYFMLLKKNNIKYKAGDFVTIPISLLYKNSSVLVDVKCDICGCINKITYQKYNKNIEKYNIYTCKKCFNIKNKITNKIKYGVENYNNSQKIRSTCFDKYGVSNVSKLENIKDKKRETLIKNYGVNNPSLSNDIKNKKTKTILIKNFNKINNLVFYKDQYYEIYCSKCKKIFSISRELYKNRKRLNIEFCTNCFPVNSFTTSFEEKNLVNFIKDNFNGTIMENVRNIIPPYELDIYLPELKLSFEFNGIYWHNNTNKNKNYHRIKSDLCDYKGIQLIHIWENDWKYKNEIIKSLILNKLNKYIYRYFSDECVVKSVDDESIKTFLENNHIQGYAFSIINFGLFFNDELISVMTFNKILDGEYELLRYCDKLYTNVDKGYFKLFKHFIEIYNPKSVIVNVDRCYFNGDIYEDMGFKLIQKTEPKYVYISNDMKKINISNFELDSIFFKIFDAGSLKYNYVK